MEQIHIELENTAKVNTSAEGSRQPQAEQEAKSRKTQRPKRITCDFIRSALDNCSEFCWAECIAVCLFCFQLAMIIAIMVKNFGPGVVSPGDIEGGVSGVLKNLESSPFSDILVASSSCPSGYERLDLGTWPGTEEICTKRTNRVKSVQERLLKCPRFLILHGKTYQFACKEFLPCQIAQCVQLVILDAIQEFAYKDLSVESQKSISNNPLVLIVVGIVTITTTVCM